VCVCVRERARERESERGDLVALHMARAQKGGGEGVEEVPKP